MNFCASPAACRARLLSGVLFCLSVLAGRAYGQVKAVPGTARPSIDLTDDDWSRGRNGKQSNFQYTVGTDPALHNAGFFGQHIRREIVHQGGLTTDVKDALNRYRRRKWLFLSERFLFIGAMGAYGGFVTASDADGPARWFKGPQQIVLGVAAFSLLTNVLVCRTTNLQMQRAVKSYQGDLMPQRPSGRLTERLRPDFGGLAPQRGGAAVVVGWQL